MGPEVNSNWFEIWNRFEKSFRLHSSFTKTNLEISNPFQKLFRLNGNFTTLMIVFSITVATHTRSVYELKWFCATLFHCGHLLFTWKTHCGLKFHFGQTDRSKICTEVSFTSPELMWTLIMKLPYTEVKFYPKVESQICLSSLRVSCKRALNVMLLYTLTC